MIRASPAIALKSQPSYRFRGWSPSHTIQIIHPIPAEALIFEPSSKSRGYGEWGPRIEGSLRPPRPREWRGRFGGLPSLGTQVEDLLELFFLISPFKFGVGDLIEGLLELLN